MRISLLDCNDQSFTKAVANAFESYEVITIDSAKSNVLPTEFFSSDYIITGRKFKITQDVIEKLTKCKTIVRNGVGYDNIDTVAARQRGIDVFNVSDYCIHDVAEHTLGLLLAYTRNIKRYCDINHSKNLKWGSATYSSLRLNGKKLGIVGMGNIGKAVSKRAEAFGLDISYFAPSVNEVGYKKFDSLNELFQNNDIVSVHVPLTSQTKGFIGANVIKNSKNVILINTSRGGVVNYDDVLVGLKKGNIQAFLTDVLDIEPPINNPIYEEYISKNGALSDRIIVTPHVAFSSQESDLDLVDRVIAIIRDKTNFKPIN